MARLFVGTFLKFPDQQRLAELPKHNTVLEEIWHRKVRWVKPAKLHLTWCFLGEVDKERVKSVVDALNETIEIWRGADEPEIEFSKLAIWPSQRNPHNLVLTTASISAEVSSLAHDLRRGLGDFVPMHTDQKENKIFRPHITLLRIVNHKEDANAVGIRNYSGKRVNISDVAWIQGQLPIMLRIDKICLVESFLGDGTNEYQVVSDRQLSKK